MVAPPIPCTALASRIADRYGRYTTLVFAGCLLTGLGCLVNLYEDLPGGPTAAVIIAVLALGIGHAISLTSQLAVIQQIADTNRGVGRASVISAYRLLERIGLVVGPIIAATLASQFGYRGAMIGIGIIVAVFAVLFAIVMSFSREEQGYRRRLSA